MNKNKIIAVKLKGPSKDKAYWQKKLTTWEAECNPIKSLERSRIEKLISVSDQGLEVEGDLNLYDYAYLTSLPADLKVGGNLNLRGRTSLISVADLEVGGDL
ncbi:hypothetical protein HOG75_04000, partial [bacterium]|nr:hypothetical protein [bacterium]